MTTDVQWITMATHAATIGYTCAKINDFKSLSSLSLFLSFSLVFSWDFLLFVNAGLDFLYHCVLVSFCCGLFAKNCGCVFIINWYIDHCLSLYFFHVMLILACLLYNCAGRLADSYACLLFLMHVYCILSCTL